MERSNYVTMLIVAMCPSVDLQNNAETRVFNARAWKMEEKIFEEAIDDSEYRKMIVDKVQSISSWSRAFRVPDEQLIKTTRWFVPELIDFGTYITPSIITSFAWIFL